MSTSRVSCSEITSSPKSDSFDGLVVSNPLRKRVMMFYSACFFRVLALITLRFSLFFFWLNLSFSLNSILFLFGSFPICLLLFPQTPQYNISYPYPARLAQTVLRIRYFTENSDSNGSGSFIGWLH